MNINHISVSRKKCFDLCKQQYKYRYHLQIPAPGPEPFYFTYGKIVHKIAEEYVKLIDSSTIEQVALDVLHGKIPIEKEKKCPTLTPHYKKKLQSHLNAIKNLTKRIGGGGITEYEFKYDLDPPNQRHVFGFIDRLILKEDKAFIIDYKTTKKGKFRVTSQTVLEDLQLRCYARVVQREFNIKPENIKAALYYLEGENLIAANYSGDSLDRVEKELRDGFICIEEFDADKVWGNVGWHCKNCDYATMCHFYSPQEKSGSKWNGDLNSLGHKSDW